MQNRISRTALGFLISALVIFAIFVGWPMVVAVIMSVRNYRPGLGLLGSDFVGLANYIDFFDTPRFSQLLANSIMIFVGSTVLAMLIAIPSAIAVGSMKKGVIRSLATIALLLPAFMPDILIAFIVRHNHFAMLREPGSFRIVMILISAIMPAAICAFVGAWP